jgi:putative flippase GtrA
MLARQSQSRRLLACLSRPGKASGVATQRLPARIAARQRGASTAIRSWLGLGSYGNNSRMHALLLRLAAQLPSPARRLATEARIRTLSQFLMFGAVGTVGFLADTATVYALRSWIGLYGAGAVAYGVAASITWVLNRQWTFRGIGSGPAHQQWARFLVVNLGGFVLNRGTYAILITFVPLCEAEPVYAVAGGAIAGMFLNFSLNRTIVFR